MGSARGVAKRAQGIEVDVLSGENNKKGLFITCSRQLVITGRQAVLDMLGVKNPRYLTIHVQISASKP